MNSGLKKGRRVAVIGAGFGGLAAAIRLQSAGVQTTLLEKRERPGGRAYVFEDEGFTFDAGPTVITAPNCIEELFALSGRDMNDYVTLVPLDPMYSLRWPDGYRLDYTADLEKMSAQIAEKSPADVDGYRKFLKYAESVFEEGYVNLADQPFLDIWSMVRVAPQLIGLKSYRSVYSVLESYIKDPQLRQAFSYHTLLVGGNPFTASAIYALIHALERKWGVFFPRGGTGALVDAFVRVFRELGGELRLNCPVERIRTSNGRVTGLDAADGWSAEFDAVASNADVVHTYGQLLGHESLAQPVASSLQRKRFSMSLVVIYFGAGRRHPQLAHHSVLFGPRYRELLDDIFRKGILADDFSLYLHAPTTTDPQIAPDGCEAFYVLSPVPHLGKGPIDWKTEGPRYRDRILAYLEKRYIPGLTDDLKTVRVFTPEDFRDVLNAHHGSAFSLEPILTQSAYFRVHNRDRRIGGLYFVGAGTHPGAGVPGVVNSAEATAGLMLSDLGRVSGGR
jgi:phytoene desaturase